MSEAAELTELARERADKRIDSALGELRTAAHDIGVKYGIPEGIAGHSVEDLLGRMSYIPSMARDLRIACGQALAKEELNVMFDAKAPARDLAHTTDQPQAFPPKILGVIPVSLDVGDLQGISVQTIKALRDAGLNKIGDVVDIPDAHLVKQPGLAEKSVAHIRAAIAKASAPS